MRVLVTGASGFVGRHLVPKLAAAGHDVHAHSHADGDLATDTTVLGRGWDAIVNLAGPVTGGAEDLHTGIDVVAAHVRIALNIRRHAPHARIVQASSMTVYGAPTALPVSEQHARRPQHLYGLGKMLAEDVLADLDTRILRLPGLFSEQRTTGALYHFCRAARAGEPLRVTTPTPTPWDILHVADAADAIARAVACETSGAYNISYGEQIDLVSVARWLAHHAGKGSSVTTAVEHPSLQLANDRARDVLGWPPPRLHERLAKLYEAYAA